MKEPAERSSRTELARQLYRHDPLLVLVRDRLGLGVGWSALGMAVLTIAVLLGVPWLARVPFSTKGLVVSALQSLLIFPIGVVIYRVTPQLDQGWQNEENLVSSKCERTSASRRANHVDAL